MVELRAFFSIIKRFKAEVAKYLGLQVTYVNYKGLSVIPDQFDICVKNKAFKTSHDTVLCTSRLKTEPHNWHLCLSLFNLSSM